MEDLDKKDRHILELLSQDARLSHNQIAKTVGLSKNAVTYRIERLQKNGVITGFFTIINYSLLGISFYEVLLKLKASESERKEFIEYLQKNPYVMVVDKLVGEWNCIFEFGCKTQKSFFDIISELEKKFAQIIEYFEVHPIAKSFKLQQLPAEFNTPKPHIFNSNTSEVISLDELDKKLILELNNNSTAQLQHLAENLSVTYETVAARIKKLKENNVIMRFTPRISLMALGYTVYVIILETKNLSKEEEKSIAQYIISNKNIRYSFKSAAKPSIFIYFSSKNSDIVEDFMTKIKIEFSNSIQNIKYFISKEQYKYELFVKGFLE